MDRSWCFAVLALLGAVSVYFYGDLAADMRRQKRLYEEKLSEQEFLRQQNQYVTDDYMHLEKQTDDLRRLRHDMTNHYVLELSYLEQGKLELLKAHYAIMLEQLKSSEKYIRTGKIGIDPLLNYKLRKAKQSQINVQWKVQTGDNIRIRDRDLNILLGNLLDNAIEAAEKMEPEKRTIFFQLKTDHTAFWFRIRNSCLPVLGQEKADGTGRSLQTSKKNKQEHGLGLGQVRDVAKKYRGHMEIRTGQDFFETSVFLYMEAEEECR